MGRLARLIDWIDAKVDRPADQSVLNHSDRDGSERMLDTDDGQQEAAAGDTVRNVRNRRRRRWLGL